MQPPRASPLPFLRFRNPPVLLAGGDGARRTGTEAFSRGRVHFLDVAVKR